MYQYRTRIDADAFQSAKEIVWGIEAFCLLMLLFVVVVVVVVTLGA
jgi:hypothetical protein